MKRLFWLAAFSLFVSCSMHEEYTPPSPIELKPRQTKPPIYDQDTPTDKFGDEGLEPVDIEEKAENFDSLVEEEKRIRDDIAVAERKNRAHKLTEAAKKNIKIERKTASKSAPKTPKVETTTHAPAQKTEPVAKPAPKAESAKLDDSDLDDLED